MTLLLRNTYIFKQGGNFPTDWCPFLDPVIDVTKSNLTRKNLPYNHPVSLKFRICSCPAGIYLVEYMFLSCRLCVFILQVMCFYPVEYVLLSCRVCVLPCRLCVLSCRVCELPCRVYVWSCRLCVLYCRLCFCPVGCVDKFLSHLDTLRLSVRKLFDIATAQ